MLLRLRGGVLDLTTPRVMGVLNLTPDSFFEGSRCASLDDLCARAARMVEDGADLLDIGAESTRPGALPVAEDLEAERVVAAVERLHRELAVPISVDTMKPGVMRAACAAGAAMINDVCGLRAPGALEAARDSGAAVCLMHMQGEPRTMQHAPHYDDVVQDVSTFLAQRARAALDAGIARDALVLDPGFGFGKTLDHNLRLLAAVETLAGLGYPLLVGLSRKSMFGQLCGAPVERRLPASLAAATAAVLAGASIVRVHDVAETRDAVRVAHAVRQSRGKQA